MADMCYSPGAYATVWLCYEVTNAHDKNILHTLLVPQSSTNIYCACVPHDGNGVLAPIIENIQRQI